MTERKSRADGVETREAILSAAEEEFAEKGYALASVRSICQRAGANVALANRYFGSKEELYRTVAKRLFGDLGAPLAALPEKSTDEASWRAALREWIDDMLFMTIPTERAQKLCAGLFAREVAQPTAFFGEFMDDFGKPVFAALEKLVAMGEPDARKAKLLTASIWSQVSVYALADEKALKPFRPKGLSKPAWRELLVDQISSTALDSLSYKNS